MARIGPAEVRERYGVEPEQVPDFIALRGDPSDKLPGAPGVGAAGAASLLRKHGSLAAILKAGRFAREAANLRLYRSIATMNRKAPLPRFPTRSRPGPRRPIWRVTGSSGNWRCGWRTSHIVARIEGCEAPFQNGGLTPADAIVLAPT